MLNWTFVPLRSGALQQIHTTVNTHLGKSSLGQWRNRTPWFSEPPSRAC